ncbi:hypothetical protein [Stenotrophomonas sp. S39]|uniref:hypothetical protein n=1 Tax=Stenotrophomonas sp. S39 TaxID=2767451 RepID=UPI00190D9F71|nr:hypothetical protein [Stenotrophomonas sp. S39]MBK0052962.1 hypothetical protein [Stenotrophomonas sp. S39]
MSKIFYARVYFFALVLGFFVEIASYVFVVHNLLAFTTGIDIAIAFLALAQTLVVYRRYCLGDDAQPDQKKVEGLATLVQGLAVFGLAMFAAWDIGGVWRTGLNGVLLVGLLLRLVVKRCVKKFDELHNSVQC